MRQRPFGIAGDWQWFPRRSPTSGAEVHGSLTFIPGVTTKYSG
jgi:hypothetical protein